MLTTALLLFALPNAHAGTCDAQLGKIAGLTAETVAAGFKDIVGCDRKVAEANFNRYLEKATDSDALLALMLTAVDGDVWNPAWGALSKISSYDARDEVATSVGGACVDHPKVVSFLQGAYFGLRDVDFSQWDDSFAACSDEKLWTWVEQQVANVPPKQFDEKYGKIVGIYTKHRRGDALPVLQAAAIKAAGNGGPFDDLLSRMSDAVQPELGRDMSAEDQQKLADAMVGVAQKVPAERAKSIASTLANAGAEGPAASLLPTLYPDRVQSGGGFLYAVGTIEAGTCGGKKTAVLHYTSASEPGKRYSILGDLEPLMRAAKPKLGKDCTVESPWPVMHSPEPIKAAGEAEAWSDSIAKEWASKGYDVKTQKEKAVALP